jgi:hypothetical protein
LAVAETGDGCAGATVEGEGGVEGVGKIGSPGASEHRERVSFTLVAVEARIFT